MTLKNLSAKMLMTVLVILGFASCKKPIYYTISTSVQPIGSGNIVATPSSESVLEGTSVTFRATPNGDYIFTGWSGSLSGTDNPATIVASSDLNIVANFRLREYPLSLSVEGEGSIQERVVSTKTDYPSGTVVELTAKAADHWIFDHWEGDMTGKENPAQITISAAKTVKAVFVKKMYDLTVTVEGEGAVQEKVVETKGTYQEGTVVELTATPATGWSFDHWEGDLSGTENPSQITVSAAKSVKAVFTKNKYAYNLKIVGPGAVDEYLIENTKGSFDYGTRLLLKAYPDEGARFLGWSGSYTGTELELELPIDSEKSIVATFAKNNAKSYQLPDLKRPWCDIKCLYSDIDFSRFPSGSELLRVDYNRDGYVDAITAFASQEGNYESICPVHFYLGQPDGTFSIDQKNDNKITGKLPRKMMYCDFNDDGLPDITIAGHGSEIPGVEGMYPMILMSNSDGTYSELRFPDLFGYHHGSSLGDFDNDGDVDFFLLDAFKGNTAFLINDGRGNFTVDKTRTLPGSGSYTCELYDIDRDGFLDLICGGSTIDDKWDNEKWSGQIIWGNGSTYNQSNKITTLPAHVSGQEIFIDFEFYDLNGDGTLEIIANTTSCGTVYENYGCWGFEVFERAGDEFVNATFKYFDEGRNIGLGEAWHVWIDMERIDDRVYLVADGKVYFELVDGKLVYCADKTKSYENGFSIYTEGVGLSDNGHIDFGCNENPYSGTSCIKITDWGMWEGFNIELNRTKQNSADLSILHDNDYVLEFYLKTTDPNVVIHFKFMSIIGIGYDDATYCYVYDAKEHKHDGQWERIMIPLNKMDVWNPEQNYWEKINHFNAIICSDGGDDIYLDEIRIRKVLSDDQ